MDLHLAEVQDALVRYGAVVVVAPPGSGKTTRVAPYLMEHAGGAGRVVLLEPRRVAARAAARRIASKVKTTLGGLVGYQVRMDRVASADTRLIVATEGILVRMFEDDPLIEDVSTVIVDEFHERSIQADLSLAMARHVQVTARPDLGIVVMSATMDPGPVAHFLGGCPVVRCDGRLFPVTITHLARSRTGSLADAASDAVVSALERTEGHVLAFFPGVTEIRTALERLEAMKRPDARILPLYGDLLPTEQDAVLDPSGGRKVVLATNVAETSITVEGVTAIVDSGLVRTMRYDPRVGLDRLETGRVSRASATQRAGRAGRTGPGLCLRLYTEAEHALMREADEPEIRRADVTAAIMDVLAWGKDPCTFGWFEHPGANSIERALRTLSLLGAVEDGSLTPVGLAMSRLPLHPRLARLVVRGLALGVGADAVALAALLAERDPPRSHKDRGRRSRSDLLDRLDELERGLISRDPCALRVDRAVKRLSVLAGTRPGESRGPSAHREEALLEAIVCAFPDRVARRREPHSPRGIMVGECGVRLADHSAVIDDELFVCVDVAPDPRRRRSEMTVEQASAADPEMLPVQGIATRTQVKFDPVARRVVAHQVTSFLDLVIEERPAAAVDDEEVEAVLAEAAATDLARALGLAKPRVAGFLARARFLSSVMPELGMPPLDEEAIAGMLPAICKGRSSFAEIGGEAFVRTLVAFLGPDLVRTLETYAPERIRVPSGSMLAVDYQGNGPPVLAVRIQEMFGARDTPSVGAGRVLVMLHLLAPNMRPQQVTQDLPSFWSTVYPQVRKELRARYPRHSWPEDPLLAAPVARPTPCRRKPG